MVLVNCSAALRSRMFAPVAATAAALSTPSLSCSFGACRSCFTADGHRVGMMGNHGALTTVRHQKSMANSASSVVSASFGGLGVPQTNLRLQGLGRNAHLLALCKHQLSIAALLRLLQAQGVALSPWFSVPGFVADMICIDVLHAIDLGVSQEILGSILFEVSAVRTRRKWCSSIRRPVRKAQTAL